MAQVVDKNLNQRTYIVQAEHTEIIFGAIIMRLFRLVEWTGALIGLSTEIESFFLGGGPAYHYATDYWVFPGKTDSTSTTQAQYNYDAYGRVTTVSPTAPGDFRQARAYEPVLGGVNLAHFHTYDPPTAKCYYTRDHLASVREMCSSTGTITSRMYYDPYGRTTTVSGTVLPTMQYAGYYFHPTSELSLTLAGEGQSTGRPYDSDLGRWLSRDPLRDSKASVGRNPYEYFLNNPIYLIDEYGLSPGTPGPHRPRRPDPNSSEVILFTDGDISKGLFDPGLCLCLIVKKHSGGLAPSFIKFVTYYNEIRKRMKQHCLCGNEAAYRIDCAELQETFNLFSVGPPD